MVSTNHSVRGSRLVARISSEDKALLEHAASLEGTSVPAFLIGHGRSAAQEVIQRHGTIQLSQMESRNFVEALLAPVKAPPARLKAALALHGETIIER